ncbi:Uncharacterized conserved protein [Phaffia rhodozyma]|uniref:Uncharacterized conserved protein n=1 Tax=Phaffia rhodozyma TaxID=264483 RepID=A0A0F7SLE8_PHARH|nr:Uncharacterized conserved protein [Phaffia rhodozyma]
MSIRALLTALAFVASTYFLLRRLIPLVTSIFSKQLSIRTISLTSVKGIHWQTTQSTDGVDRAVSLKVGRVGYVFHWYDRSRRARSWLTLTIEDVDVFIEETTAEPSSSAPPAASVPGSPFSSHPLGAHATPPGSILSSPQIFDSPDQRRPSGLLTPQFSPSPEDSSRPPSISNTSRPSLLSAATGGSAIFSPYAFSESAGGYFPDPSQASSPFYTQLKRRSKRLLRKALEKSLRSAFNATPGLAKLVDVEIVGDVKLKFFQRVQLDSEKEEVDQNGETIIQGFLASLKGKLRISTSVDLQAPDFNPHVSGHKSIVREGRVRRAQNQARWFRAIVNNVWKRGIGKSVGVGRIVLEIPNEGGIEIKAIEAPRGGPPDGVSEKRLKRASTFSSLGPKTSPSAYPEKLSPSTSPTPRRRRTSTSTSFELPFKRSTSFASLPSALLGSFGSKSIGAYTLDSSLPSILRSSNEPTVNEACRSMINLQGPLSLSVGHQFGPGIELIGEQTVIIEAGFDGKIAVGLNAVEAFVDERKRAKRLRESEFKARLEKMREKEKTAEESVEFTSEITLERNSKVDDANNKKNVKKQHFIYFKQSFTVNHPFDSESDSENGSHIHNSSQTRILPLELALKGFLSTYRVSHIDTCALYRSYRGIQRPHDSESNRSIGCELQSAILSIGPWKKHHIYPWFGGQSLKPLIQIEGARINMYTNLLRLKKGFGSGKKPALFADDPNERLMVCESELKKFKGTAELEDLEALVLARKARRQLEKEQKAFDRATSSDFGHTYEEPPSDHMPEPPLPLFSLSRSIVSKFPRFACAASLGEVNLVLSAEGPDSVCRPAFVFECGGGSFAANGEHQGFVPKKSKKNTRPNSGHSSIRALPYASLFVFESAGSIKSMQISLRDTNPRALELDAFHDLPILSISSSHSTCKGRLHQVLESSSLPVSDGLALDDTTTMIDLIYTVGEVRGDLWDPSAIENLSQFMIPVEAFRQRLKRYSTPPQDSSPQDATDEASLFRRLPVGLCAHVSIESVTLVIAALDPNPSCQKGLLRGLFVKARPVWEYCYYQPQHVELASIKSSPTRTALHLPPDIAVQAAAFATDGASKKGGLAALIAMQSHDFSFRPIFNARSFASGHSTNTKLFTPYAAMFPVPEGKDAGLIAWDFQQVHRGQELKGDEESDGEKKEKKKSHTDSHPLGSADSSISDPFGLTAAEKSSTPLRIPLVESRLLLRTKLDTDIASEHTLSIDLGSISARINLSHLYCVMCAIDAIKSLKPSASSSLSQSTKLSFSESTSSCPPSRSPSPQSSLKALPFTLHVVLSSLHLDVDLPLGERIFVRLRNVSIGLSHPGEVSFDLDTALALVPSPRQRTKWEELFRLRKVRVAITRRGFQSDIAANIDGMRLRIPYSYKLSQLILNINITIKAVKHIILMFKESNMSLVLAPKVEGPKHVPNIHLKCNVVTFEAKDDPMETKLNLIWRVGLEEQQARLEREDAFEAKVRAIRSSKDHQPALAVNEMLNTSRWEFTDKHSVSIEDARNRLHMFNSTNWIRRHRNAVREQGRREDEALRRVYGPSRPDPRLPIDVLPPPQELKDFLYERGNKLPHSTKFSLLVPLHIHWLLDSAKWVLRDYPIPLFNLPPLESSQHGLKKAFEFETDLVIGEELAEEGSYFWVPTVVIPPDLGAEGASSFQLSVAKTVMPVKTYAAPVIRVNTSSVTDFCWGASYQPGIQDLMKVIETLSHPPRDPSERMGFWDKLRLVLHWTIDISFFGPLHVHAKGSRNPYDIVEHGAGFVLAWTGKPRLMINQPNEERELVQIEADSLLFAIPDFRDLQDQKAMGNPDPDSDDDVNVEREYHPRSKKILRKICAKFTNGARVGWGFMIERTCGDECESCSGPPLQRKCRMFDFKPHYTVVMKTPEAIAKHHDPKTYDSFRGFRSNYIHASMSVVSPIRRRGIDKGEPGFLDGYNSFHFSPKGFAHFFAWWRLFGGNMTLPIRQGRLFPNSPPPSKKFGKAMATFKYRFDLSPLFISHLYRYESKADWESGEGSLLGLKVQLAHFQADLHQREEQRTVTNAKLNRTKKVLHKPFYAADVVLDNLDLRALFAHIKEPENSNVKLDESTFLDDKFSTQGAPLSDPIWFDFDDYVETDWRPSDRKPKVELHPLALCPRFTYTKRAGDCCLPRKDSEDSNQRSDSDPRQASKFGKEPSHLYVPLSFSSAIILGYIVLRTLGVQTDFAEHRRKNLQDILDQYQGDDATKGRDFMADGVSAESEVSVQDSLKQKIAVLDRHIHELRESDKDEDFDEKPTFHVSGHNRQESAPLDAASPRHARFGNSYQAHFPRVTWSNHSRNIVLKYYYHARAWRGFEYHMSSLAVKFIREMTSTSSKHPDQPAANEPHKKPAAPPSPPPAMKIPTTQAAGAALTKGILNMISKEILTGSRSEEEELGPQQGQSQRTFIHRDGVAPTPDPWTGLTDDFEIEQSHHLSLIKPQIALCSVVDDDSAVVLAALSTEVQMYTVFDKQDMDDPVNAKVMRR